MTAAMAARILITLRSHQAPDAPLSETERAIALANKACQKLWDRDFDPKADRLTQEGAFAFPNQRCSLLVDTGSVDSQSHSTTWVKWDGKDIVVVPGPVSAYIMKKLRDKFQFNPAERPTRVSMTDAEYKQKYGLEKYEQHVRARSEMLKKAKEYESSSTSKQ